MAGTLSVNPTADWAMFLETFQLYKKWGLPAQGADKLDRLPKPSINMRCDGCGDRRTFRMENNWGDDCAWALPGGGTSRADEPWEQIVRAIYASVR